MSHHNLSRLIGLSVGVGFELGRLNCECRPSRWRGMCGQAEARQQADLHEYHGAQTPTLNTIAARVEAAARDLGQNRRISGCVAARDNASAAPACVQAALQ